MTQPQDMRNFEATKIQDGAEVEFVLRRRGPKILDHLTPRARKAVLTYAATAEAVLAGGARGPSDMLTGGCSGGTPSKEGRQAGFVDQVTFLKAMRAGVEIHPTTRLRARPVVEVSTLAMFDRLVVGDVPVAHYLTSVGLTRTRSARGALIKAFEAAAERVADAIAATRAFDA